MAHFQGDCLPIKVSLGVSTIFILHIIEISVSSQTSYKFKARPYGVNYECGMQPCVVMA